MASPSQVSTLGTFVAAAAASSSGGFLAKLNTAMATAGVSINVTSVTVVKSPKATDGAADQKDSSTDAKSADETAAKKEKAKGKKKSAAKKDHRGGQGCHQGR